MHESISFLKISLGILTGFPKARQLILVTLESSHKTKHDQVEIENSPNLATLPEYQYPRAYLR